MSDTPTLPKTYDHLSEIDRQVFLKLDLIRELRRAKETPFYDLLRDISYHRHKFMQKFGVSPTTAFIGQKQYQALSYAPPHQMTATQEARARRGEQTINGLEVILVLRDDFLQVV